MKILKKIKNIFVSKKQRVTFYVGIKGYRYYKKRWETLLERVHIKSVCRFSSIILLSARQNFEGILSYLKKI